MIVIVEEIFDEMPSEKHSPSEEVVCFSFLPACFLLHDWFPLFQDPANLSKKVDWDLKRIIEKPLAKLERRTQRAIAELIRKNRFLK